MQDKEFVANGEAYITTREWEPMTCNFCGQETRTHIRVPSLNTYLWWCENCQKVPTPSWDILTPNSDLSDDYDNLSGATVNQFDSYINMYMRSGYPYYRARQLAIDEYRKWLRRKQSTDYFSDLKEEYLPKIKMSIISVIDLNRSVQKLLSVLDEKERKVLALSIEEYRLDEILDKNIRDQLFKDIDTSSLESYTKISKARTLGYSFKDRSLKAFHKTLGSLVQKSKNIFPSENL